MTLSRRSLITGLASLVCAPAIVRVGSIMPVKAWTFAPEDWVEINPILTRYRAQYIRAMEESIEWLRRTSDANVEELFHTDAIASQS